MGALAQATGFGWERFRGESDRLPDRNLALLEDERLHGPVPEQEAARQSSGERRLLAAILDDAVRVLRRYPGDATVWAWVESADDTPCTAFVAICGYLGLEPTYVRRGLREGRWGKRRFNRVVDIRRPKGVKKKNGTKVTAASGA